MSLAASAKRARPQPEPHDARARLGTRGSALALTQTRSVADLLTRRFPSGAFPIVTIHTEGDRDKTSPLSVIGGRGVFTSALEAALLAGEIDAAVHSAKDLPSTLPSGLTLSAFPAREDPRDVLVSRHGLALERLPSDPVIGTSSRRRAFQLLRLRPDARIVELRGNLDTRLRKAAMDDLDGVILAAAGIARMGWSERITHFLPVDQFVPAPGQGALAIETRALPDPAAALVGALDDARLASAVGTERAFLRGVGGGCTSPIGAYADVSADGEEVVLTAILASDDNARWEQVQERYPAGVAAERAFDLGGRMLAAISRLSVTPGVAFGALAGRRVLVTGAGALAERLTATLRDAGAQPMALPLIRIAPSSRPDEVRSAVDRLASGAYSWLVVTSVNAVDALIAAFRSSPGALLPADLQIAAVGSATASRLRDAGFRVGLVPSDQTAAGLVEALRQLGIAGQRILCPLGNLARPTLADGLRGLGGDVDVVEAYRTEPASDVPDEIGKALREGAIDILTFASPSAAESFAKLLARMDLPHPNAVVACIGPTTRDAAAALGFSVAVVAGEPSAQALVNAIAAHMVASAEGD